MSWEIRYKKTKDKVVRNVKDEFLDVYNGVMNLDPDVWVRCRTEAEAKALLEWADRQGMTWIDDDSYKVGTYWDKYKESTVYNLRQGIYNRVGVMIKREYVDGSKARVVDFTDFFEDEGTREGGERVPESAETIPERTSGLRMYPTVFEIFDESLGIDYGTLEIIDGMTYLNLDDDLPLSSAELRALADSIDTVGGIYMKGL